MIVPQSYDKGTNVPNKSWSMFF